MTRIGIVVLAVLCVVAEVRGARDALASGRPLLGAGFAADAATTQRFAGLLDGVGTGRTVLSAQDRRVLRDVAVAEPLSPVPYVLSGAAAGDRAGQRLIDMARHRDPRFRPALAWQLGSNLRAQDLPGATRTVIRMIELDPQDPRLIPVLVTLTGSPAARRVIRAALSHNPPWRFNFIGALNANVDPAVVFELTQAGQQGARPSADAMQRQSFIARLIGQNEYDRAYLAWVQWLGADAQAGLGPVFDGTFKHYSALPPFNWELPSDTGAATFASGGGLAIDYAGTDQVVLAHQVLLLPAGRYRLVARAKLDGNAGGGDSPIGWTLTCMPGERALSGIPLRIGGPAQASASPPFAIDAACAAQSLALAIKATDTSVQVTGTAASIAVERVAS